MVKLTALSSRSGEYNCNILYFYVSHGSSARFLSGEKYYIYFVGDSFLFPTVKRFSKLVNN